MHCATASIDYKDIPPEDFGRWIAFAEKYPEEFRDVIITDGLHYEIYSYSPSYLDADDALPATHWRYIDLMRIDK